MVKLKSKPKAKKPSALKTLIKGINPGKVPGKKTNTRFTA